METTIYVLGVYIGDAKGIHSCRASGGDSGASRRPLRKDARISGLRLEGLGLKATYSHVVICTRLALDRMSARSTECRSRNNV